MRRTFRNACSQRFLSYNVTNLLAEDLSCSKRDGASIKEHEEFLACSSTAADAVEGHDEESRCKMAREEQV